MFQFLVFAFGLKASHFQGNNVTCSMIFYFSKRTGPYIFLPHPILSANPQSHRRVSDSSSPHLEYPRILCWTNQTLVRCCTESISTVKKISHHYSVIGSGFLSLDPRRDPKLSPDVGPRSPCPEAPQSPFKEQIQFIPAQES